MRAIPSPTDSEATPVGAAINPFTGVFSWTPTAAQAGGTYVIAITVTDTSLPNLSDTENLSVVVSRLRES